MLQAATARFRKDDWPRPLGKGVGDLSSRTERRNDVAAWPNKPYDSSTNGWNSAPMALAWW